MSKKKECVKDVGCEYLDPTPIEVPLSLRTPETLEQKIARLVKSSAMATFAAREGKETFEESEDFNVEDDSDDFTKNAKWEVEFDPVEEKKIVQGFEAARKPQSKVLASGKSKAPKRKPKEVENEASDDAEETAEA